MKSIDAAIVTAMEQPTVRGIYFVRLHFDDGVVAWHTGFDDLAIDGIVYKGAGMLGSVSVVKEETGLKAASVNVGLSGIPEEAVALLLGERYINRKTYVHFVPLDDGDQPAITAGPGITNLALVTSVVPKTFSSTRLAALTPDETYSVSFVISSPVAAFIRLVSPETGGTLIQIDTTTTPTAHSLTLVNSKGLPFLLLQGIVYDGISMTDISITVMGRSVPIVSNPVLLFKGTMDSINGTMGSNAGFSVSLKSRLADWERPRKILYSDVEQQQLYPGDLGMEYIAQISQKKLIWPKAAFLPDARD